MINKIYDSLSKFTRANLETKEFTYKKIFWISLIMGLTVFTTILISSLKLKIIQKMDVDFFITFKTAITYAIGFFLMFLISMNFGKFVANLKFTEKTKKIIAILVWLSIILVFLLPFIMVYIFGFE